MARISYMASGNLIESPSPQPLSRKYLRAIHDFTCSSADEPRSLSCDLTDKVTLRKGDVIIVHLTHVNGWADGTVLNSGRRGWFPAYYCEAYDHEYIRYFFHGITRIWTAAARDNSTSSWVAGRRDEIQPLIFGVRHVLEQTNCLRRGSSTVEAIPLLHRVRRSLLSNLTTLVRRADRLAELATTPVEAKTWSALTDEYKDQAFQVAIKLVRFMDIWDHHAEAIDGCTSPVTELSPASKSFGRLAVDRNKEQVCRYNDYAFALDTEDRRTPPPITPKSPRSVNRPHTPSLQRDSVLEKYSPEALRKCRSQPSLRPSSKTSTNVPARSRPLLATYQLTVGYGLFTKNMEKLLQLDEQTHAPNDIRDFVFQALDSATSLLALVNYIRAHASPHLDKLNLHIDAFEGHLAAFSNLVQPLSGQEQRKPSSLPDGELQDSLETMIAICQRAASESVSEARCSLAEDGDFVLDIEVVLRLKESWKPHDSSVCFSPSSRTIASNATSPCSPTYRMEEQDFYGGSPRRLISEARSSSFLRQSNSRRLRNRRSTLEKEVDLRNDEDVGKKDKMEGRPTTSSSTSEFSSWRDSTLSSQTESTRATSPDSGPHTHNAKSDGLRVDIGGCSWEFPKPGCQDKGRVPEYAKELLLDDSAHIIGGKPHALALSLVYNHEVVDSAFVRAFFLSFRKFMTPMELASILIKHYQNPEAILSHRLKYQVRITDLIRQWLDQYWDHETDQVVLEKLRTLFGSDKTRSPLFSHHVLQENISRRMSEPQQIVPPCSGLSYLNLFMDGHGQQRRHSLPSGMAAVQPTESSDGLHTKVDLLDLSPVELARQLTLMASGLFCMVEPTELLAATSAKASDRAAHVRAISRLSTDITSLVSHSIVDASELETRIEVLKRWIIVAQLCFSMENYDTLMAIMCSLNSTAIARLHNTWSQLPPKVFGMFEELKEVTDFTRNFARLRQRVRAAKGPCVPFLGIFLTDITFANAGNSSTRTLTGMKETDKAVCLVNFDKYLRLGSIVEAVQRLQRPYRIRETPQVQSWLEIKLQGVQQREQSEGGGTAGISSLIHQQSKKLEPKGEASSRLRRNGSQSQSALVRKMLLDGSMDSIIPKMGLGIKLSRSELRRARTP